MQTYLVPWLGGQVPKTTLSMEHQTATHKRYKIFIVRRTCLLGGSLPTHYGRQW